MDTDLLRLTADIVSAHVSKNTVPANGLPELIQSVYAALGRAGAVPEDAVVARQLPAVPVKKSVFPDFIVCLEDGKKLSMLKRHLQTSYGLTPDAYRAKWNLPSDYPMVAPNYATRRSELAKEFGLGRKPDAAEDISTPAPVPEAPVVEAASEVEGVVVQRIPERKRGRKALMVA